MRLLLYLSLPFITATAYSADCAKFEPHVSHLVGRLISREYPGPPNYKSVAAGDEPERQWLILLSAPLCVDGDPNSELNVEAQAGVSVVQLVVTKHAGKLTTLLGSDIVVVGTLFTAHTAHHRTPVLLMVSELRPKSLERSR